MFYIKYSSLDANNHLSALDAMLNVYIKKKLISIVVEKYFNILQIHFTNMLRSNNETYSRSKDVDENLELILTVLDKYFNGMQNIPRNVIRSNITEFDDRAFGYEKFR